MDDLTAEGVWLRAVLGRSLLVGFCLGMTALAGSAMVLQQTGAGTVNATVLIGTVLLALFVGLWAGAPAAAADEPPLRERWLAAASLTAVAGAAATISTLYQGVYPGAWWRVGGMVVVVATPCYGLGLLIPSLFAWADRWVDELEDDQTAWAALGPVAAGLLAGSAAGVLLAGLVALPVLPPGSLLMAAALFLLLPLVSPDPAGVPAREVEIFGTVSPFGSLRVTEVRFPAERQPERRLYLNDEEESGQLVRSGAPTLAYIAAAEHWLNQITPKAARYLFLGGGAYTLPRRLMERDPGASVAVVELDPEVTRIAYRFFGVHRQHRIITIEGDARAYLEHDDGVEYDRIYVDVYGGREALPHSLVTRDAAVALARRMRPGGVVGLNVIGTVVGEESRQVWSVVKTFSELFPTVKVYTHLGPDFADRQNVLLGCSIDPDRTLPATAGHFEEWPRDEWPAVEGTTVFRDLVLRKDRSSEFPAGQPVSSERP
ncbi:MAG: fused MFS/spermidine synthase [Gemmatimonadota bacterium]